MIYRSISFTTVITFAVCAQAADQVTVKREGATFQVTGKVLTEAQDDGLLLCAPDGVLWMIQADEIAERNRDIGPFKPLSAEQIGKNLLAQLPDDFKVHRTAHYVICYNTSSGYAQWCGALYERLFKAFYTYWSNLGWKLNEPEIPLVALVFDTKDTYARYAKANNGLASAYGYYNFLTNRVVMYDLTGVEGSQRIGRAGTAARINQVLQQPAAAPTVATIVHEATHQIAYNSGLQVRLADNPLWVSEGLAIYFETPDLRSSKGWRGIGSLNRNRLVRFRKYLAKRPNDSLLTLISDDRRFRDATTALDSYAEAWALNFYLLRARKKQYVKYLRMLAEKTPAVEDGAASRISEFKEAFGPDLAEFDAGFIHFARRLR